MLLSVLKTALQEGSVARSQWKEDKTPPGCLFQYREFCSKIRKYYSSFGEMAGPIKEKITVIAALQRMLKSDSGFKIYSFEIVTKHS